MSAGAAPNLHSTANHWHGVSYIWRRSNNVAISAKRDRVKIKNTFAANSWLIVGTGWAAYWTDDAPILFRTTPPAAGTALWVADYGEIPISFVAWWGIPQR